MRWYFILVLIWSTTLQPVGALPEGYESIPQTPVVNFTFLEDDALGNSPVQWELKDFQGKMVILHFWSMGCPSCVTELSDLDRFSQLVDQNKISVVSICIDRPDPGRTKGFFTTQGYRYLKPYCNASVDRPSIKQLPTTIFINSKGEQVGKIQGVAPWQQPDMIRFANQLTMLSDESQKTWHQKLVNWFSGIKDKLFARSTESTKIKSQTQREPMKKHHTKVLIIGSGPAGYTAAIYAARANLKPVQLLGSEPGGQLMVTTDVENYPGFENVIQGPWLMEQMKAQAEHVGTEMVHEQIIKADLSKRPFICQSDGGATFTADTLIIATGAQAKWLGIPSETKFRGFGVSGCATCDGFFFKGKTVAVVGGGNTAVEDALFLTHFANKVYLVHRRDQLRAEKMLQERLFKNPKIEIIWDHVVDEVIGKENPKEVNAVKLKNVKTGALQTLKVQGVFIAIGHTPRSELFKEQLELDKEGYIKVVPGTTATQVPGVFAAGDVADKVYRQAVTAAGLGCMAALEAEKFLASQTAEASPPKAAASSP
jgi:thioredoxin reductase (NADPH)